MHIADLSVEPWAILMLKETHILTVPRKEAKASSKLMLVAMGTKHIEESRSVCRGIKEA